MTLTNQTRAIRFLKALNIMHENNLTLVRTNGKSEMALSETIAAIVQTVHNFGAKLAIGWQRAESSLICRYVTNLNPRLFIDLTHRDDDKLIISLSNGDIWHANHDELMPSYAVDLAIEISEATRRSKRVIFKQQSLKRIVGGLNHAN